MASARARLGKARRGIIQRKKTTDVVTGALSAVGTVAAFGAGQVKKADTAWKEYEAGYEALGGEDFKRPKWGDEGYFKSRFKGPEGDVTIGKKIYDREKVQKAGSFLSSEASAVLDEGARTRYLERTAPGREIPTLQQPATILEGTSGVKVGGVSVSRPISDAPISTPSVSGVIPTSSQFPTQDYKQTVTGTPYTPSRQHAMPGPNVNIDIPSMIKERFLGSFTGEGFTGEGGGTGVKTGVSQIPEDPYSYQNMLNIGTAQDQYTEEQRQPYYKNPRRSFLETWGLSRNKDYAGTSYR